MHKKLFLFAILISACFLVSCTAGPNPSVNTATSGGTIAGFLLGLWHGLISPITFIISLFTTKVSFYEVHNNGGWYNWGFVLGAGILFGVGRGAASKSRARQSEMPDGEQK